MLRSRLTWLTRRGRGTRKRSFSIHKPGAPPPFGWPIEWLGREQLQRGEFVQPKMQVAREKSEEGQFLILLPCIQLSLSWLLDCCCCQGRGWVFWLVKGKIEKSAPPRFQRSFIAHAMSTSHEASNWHCEGGHVIMESRIVIRKMELWIRQLELSIYSWEISIFKFKTWGHLIPFDALPF